MKSKVRELLKFAKEENLSITKNLALVIYKISSDFEIKEHSKEIYNETITIDLWELESLINSEKFEYPETDLDEVIGVENENS